MNQMENSGDTAHDLVRLVHDSAVGFGLPPVPTMIILGLGTMFGLVGMVVGGRGRGRLPRHSHRA